MKFCAIITIVVLVLVTLDFSSAGKSKKKCPETKEDKLGKIEVHFKGGKKTAVGRGTLHADETHIDYCDRPYPSELDMKDATEIVFTPDTGSKTTYDATYDPHNPIYFNNAEWLGPRLVLKKK
ncbi:unnamed protein product [Didymodactylos carnosus]|uniref:Uncharacterized protein n=1 Tax=Didymodactylos carnosus TaxID=1234261 RepID=A0A815IUS9_9BILA|nr:unnamed protein product [Didymodactylos carnosus]CAF1373712.1 unnamed protein product [Didymodactylos carnosus]CAF4013888.1 unnamed protein product [Didymodactylos carnosus]CAF4262413.1 unnamed protein product [Didymodactylos carnosus]